MPVVPSLTPLGHTAAPLHPPFPLGAISPLPRLHSATPLGAACHPLPPPQASRRACAQPGGLSGPPARWQEEGPWPTLTVPACPQGLRHLAASSPRRDSYGQGFNRSSANIPPHSLDQSPSLHPSRSPLTPPTSLCSQRRPLQDPCVRLSTAPPSPCALSLAGFSHPSLSGSAQDCLLGVLTCRLDSCQPFSLYLPRISRMMVGGQGGGEGRAGLTCTVDHILFNG